MEAGRELVKPVEPQADPVASDPLQEFLLLGNRAARLLIEHVDDGTGRCSVCSQGGQAGHVKVAVPAGDGSAARRGTPGPMTPEARHRMRGFGLVAIGVVMVPYRLEPRTRRQRTQPAKIRADGAETAQQCGRVRPGKETLPGNAGYRSDHQMPRWSMRRAAQCRCATG